MRIQTVHGSFLVHQNDSDHETGMLKISSQNSMDLESFVGKFLPDGVIQHDEKESPDFFVRSSAAKIALAIGQAVADVYYSDFVGESVKLRGSHLANWLDDLEDVIFAYPQIPSSYDINHSLIESGKPELVFKIGVECGSVKLWSHDFSGIRRFSINTDEDYSGLIDEGDDVLVSHTKSDYGSWEDAMKNMPKSWHQFYPVDISEKFWPLIAKELRNRGVDQYGHSSGYGYSISYWQGVMERSKEKSKDNFK